MAICPKHEAERAAMPEFGTECDDCCSEAAQAARDKRHDDYETARFRDRCALSVLISLMHIHVDTTSFHIHASEAYIAADAMLAERAKGQR